MVRWKPLAATLVAVLACLHTPAWGQEPTATPVPQPPLSEDPPTPLDGGGDTPEPPEPSAGPELPNTGADALLVALVGLGLVGTGTGLRITVSRLGG